MTTKKGRKPPESSLARAVHDDRVQREFTVERPDHLRLTDISEHPTGEGTLYLLCASRT